MGMGLICRECGERLRVPESAAGKLGKCPKCQALVRVPTIGHKNARVCDRCGKSLARERVIHERPGKAYCNKCIRQVTDKKDKTRDRTPDDLGLKPQTPQDKAAGVARPRKLGKGQRAADVFLIRLLTEQEVLEEKDVPHLLKYQKAVGKRLIPLMRDANLIDEEEIVKSICETTGLQACPPGDFKIAKNVQGLMDTKTMSRFDAVPLKREGKAVFVAIPNPLDVSAFQQLREKLGTVVIPRVCTWSQYTSARYFLKGAKKTKTSAK